MERWLDIPGYEGRYQASNHGRVRSLDREVRTVSRHGTEATRVVRGRLLKPQKHSQGYQQVALSGDLFLVHALVLLAFVGARPLNAEVAHNDGRKTNNAVNNLRYATAKSNAEDRRKHGTSGAGEKNTGAKLSAHDVTTIRELAKVKAQRLVAARFGVTQATVSKIVRRERWSSL
jgi:DNA-binding transcriptional regulator YiaG